MTILGIPQNQVNQIKDLKLKSSSRYYPIMAKYDELNLCQWFEIKEDYQKMESSFPETPDYRHFPNYTGKINPSENELVNELRKRKLTFFLVNAENEIFLNAKIKNKKFRTNVIEIKKGKKKK